MDDSAGSLEALLALADRDEAAGLGDAPWPPHFQKAAGEAKRVTPSRAKAGAKRGAKSAEESTTKSTTKSATTGAAKTSRRGSRTPKMPLLTIANSPSKEEALAGLERWKAKYPEAASHLAVDDVLVDSMRGRSSTWTRIRVNLRHVPEAERPPQETPDPDDDPTREDRERFKKRR
jgi:hypothetical protein